MRQITVAHYRNEANPETTVSRNKMPKRSNEYMSEIRVTGFSLQTFHHLPRAATTRTDASLHAHTHINIQASLRSHLEYNIILMATAANDPNRYLSPRTTGERARARVCVSVSRI